MIQLVFHEDSRSFINKLSHSISRGIHFSEPASSLRTDENKLVCGVIQMLQGFSSSFFIWDENKNCFRVRSGAFVSHLSQTSLGCILDQFVYSGTSLKLVELFVRRVEALKTGFPTLEAFAGSVSLWLKRLRSRALLEEVNSHTLDSERTATLLGLTNSLSSLCSGGEHLLQVVNGAVPRYCLYAEASIPAADVSVHILDYLYKRLNEVSPVQGGEEEAYHMLVFLFLGSLLPYLKGLNSWLFDGILDDPYEEMFFYENNSVTIDQPAFWDQSYLLRFWRFKSFPDTFTSSLDDDFTVQLKGVKERDEHILQGKDHNDLDAIVCPLVQFLNNESHSIFGKVSNGEEKYTKMRECLSSKSTVINHLPLTATSPECTSSINCETVGLNDAYRQKMFCSQGIGSLTLSEIFLVSFVGLVCDGNHIFDNIIKLCDSFSEICNTCEVSANKQKMEEVCRSMAMKLDFEKFWWKFFLGTIMRRNKKLYIQRNFGVECMVENISLGIKKVKEAALLGQDINDYLCTDDAPSVQSFYPENPAITVCRELLEIKSAFKEELNISKSFHLPSLDDEMLWKAIFGGNTDVSGCCRSEGTYPGFSGTDYAFGFKFNESDYLRLAADVESLGSLYPFPTILPCGTDGLPMSEVMPFQENSTVASRILNWFQNVNLKASPLPSVIIQNCLQVFVKKKIDQVGKHILQKLMDDWRLMEELRVLRAIYLCGSGDILQHFLISIFGKLEKGDSCDDDLNAAILCSPDSLTILIAKDDISGSEEYAMNLVSTPRKVQSLRIGANDLDFLKFTYKVPWPLDLIVNADAIDKYSLVMRFLLRVKHAKFVLDKARMWMWKRKGCMTRNQKRQLLVEQKLLHFVDAFHQYVMDRVFHSGWIELCHNMALAGSLDEVIAVHEAYLFSVQRQCFVAPDKLWSLIANRIKIILGLAVDFYSIQRTLLTGAAAPAIKTRCEMEVDRIEKQFDDCISFLLRILSFKLNVGQFPHLVDLVTRINFNHFYMSNSGNLLTTPSFEPASKVGKTYPS
ncbi:unnamed protein product [Spirodela intermedia]|uniref:Gamma-tubulin complex component n=1 Tax=Spirodela intermedia TaxID=51605 RepID=A0A7I8IPG3_SPIIN|nr:unnamed protein product [Spirodela intermedia]CAA6659670.1 unnamed protein product [Spirodela intermedia]